MSVNSQVGVPGQAPATFTAEAEIFWGGTSSQIEILRASANIDAAAVDAGNTPTTTLRGGLIMGKVTATGKVVAWDPDAVDGSETVYGVLPNTVNMLDAFGQAEEKFTRVVVKAPVKVSELLIEGAAMVGSGDEAAARTGLNAKRFALDDEFV